MSNITCIGIPANSDVSGIGIRINLYVTMLLMVAIQGVDRAKPLLEALVGNAGISALSLLITAVVETAQKQLSLYHAIFIIHILSFTTLVVVPSGKYEGNETNLLVRRLISRTMTLGSVIFYAGYAIYVWATAPTFGMIPECNNEIKYIFFFVSVRATVGWLRIFCMAFLGMGILGLLSLGLRHLWSGGRGQGTDGRGQGSDGGGWSFTLKKMAGKCLNLVIIIYGIVMLELYGNRNKDLVAKSENQWTFGQIMALVQIIGTSNEMLHFIISLFSTSDEKQLENSGSTNSKPILALTSEPSEGLQNVV